LYRYSQCFEELLTERLLGDGVLPEHLNGDVLGRTLDKIYEYGCTEFLALFRNLVIAKFPSSSPDIFIFVAYNQKP